MNGLAAGALVPAYLHHLALPVEGFHRRCAAIGLCPVVGLGDVRRDVVVFGRLARLAATPAPGRAAQRPARRGNGLVVLADEDDGGDRALGGRFIPEHGADDRGDGRDAVGQLAGEDVGIIAPFDMPVT